MVIDEATPPVAMAVTPPSASHLLIIARRLIVTDSKHEQTCPGSQARRLHHPAGAGRQRTESELSEHDPGPGATEPRPGLEHELLSRDLFGERCNRRRRTDKLELAAQQRRAEVGKCGNGRQPVWQPHQRAGGTMSPLKPSNHTTASLPTPADIPYDAHQHRNSKPPYSFSCLIFMAIEDSPSKRLPVKEIYNWILEHFPYFVNAPTGWKNSVRHNLSLNKCFKKVEKEKGQSIGKGSLWMIDPAYRPNLLQALKKTPIHPYHHIFTTPPPSPQQLPHSG
ncbi:Forkhead box protein N3, partial [Branchiostoma belcheri]